MTLIVWTELSHSANFWNITYLTKSYPTCCVISIRLKPVTEEGASVCFLLMNFTSSGSEERPYRVYWNSDCGVLFLGSEKKVYWHKSYREPQRLKYRCLYTALILSRKLNMFLTEYLDQNNDFVIFTLHGQKEKRLPSIDSQDLKIQSYCHIAWTEMDTEN